MNGEIYYRIFAESKTVNDLRLFSLPASVWPLVAIGSAMGAVGQVFRPVYSWSDKNRQRVFRREGGGGSRHLPVATSNAPTKGELTKRQRQQISPSGHTNSFLSTVAETQKNKETNENKNNSARQRVLRMHSATLLHE
jgi:hypothetical protein